ncbi:hypothetical protein [Flagellimonas marinaquae]
MKRNPYLLILLLFFGLQPLLAQKRTFQQGYIIELTGDTIQGLLKDRSPEPFVSLYNKVRFKKEGKGRTFRYSPDDILGYGLQGEHFISMPFKEESNFFKFRYYTNVSAPRTFLKVVRISKNLMYLEQFFVHDDNSYLDFIPFFYKPGSTTLVRVTQGILGFKKKALAAYFSDCPEIAEELYADLPTIQSVPELYEFYIVHCTQ